MEIGRVRPSTDGQECLEMSVFFLQLVKCFEVAVEVLAGLIPGVARIVDVRVRPRVGDVDNTRVRSHIRESVQNMPGDQCKLSRRVQWMHDSR